MTKIIRPLFGNTATGRVADIGSFRASPSGPQFIRQARNPHPRSPAQQTQAQRFRTARAAWMALPLQNIQDGNKTIKRRIPDWPTFWRQWLVDHP